MLTAILWLGVLATPVLRAETNCTGATYTAPNCNGKCPPVNCVDMSQDGDGTLFQCCGTYVPEMSTFAAPILVLVSFLGALAWHRRRRSRPVA